MPQLRTVRSRSLPPRAVMRVANIVVSVLLRSPLHPPDERVAAAFDLHGAHEWPALPNPLRVSARGEHNYRGRAGNPWWKNPLSSSPVVMRVAGEELSGIATPVEDKAIAAEELMAFLRKMPRLAKMYHATLTPDGHPDPTSVKAAVDLQVVVRVALYMTPLPSS